MKLMGYDYTDALSLRHQFQFANSTVLAIAFQEDRQALLNVFNKWCQGTNFKIPISKCRCFSIKKNQKQSTQFRAYLKVNNEMIPAVKLNVSFVYLRKEFCFNMSCENVKCDLGKRHSDYLKKIDNLFLHLKHKINILIKLAYSKLKWDPTILHLPETQSVQNLENKAN